ncbi:MAG: hypothetical protein WCV50_06350 [Patescibacteria group bacterium]|jgi:hypothetical protein
MLEKKLDSKYFLIIGVGLAAIICLTLAGYFAPSKFFSSPSHEGISLVRDDQELGVYYERMGFARQGEWPYQMTRIEYPVLGVLYLAIPALLTKTFLGYELGLILLNLLATLGVVILTYRICRQLGNSPAKIWLFLLPSVLFYIINRFDIWPVLLVQIALWLLFSKRFTWAFVFLGLSFLAKGYAIILFPIFFLYWLNQVNYQKTRLYLNKGLLAALAPFAFAMLVLFIFAGVGNSLFPYLFQSSRGFAYGAPYAVYLGSLQSFTPAWLYNIGISALGWALMLLQIILPLIFYIGYQIFRKFVTSPQKVITWSLLFILIYIQFSPYYSPQWILWILPLFILSAVGWKGVGAFIFYDLLNYLQFPVVWDYIGHSSTIFAMIVIVRSIVFVILIWQIGRRAFKGINFSRAPAASEKINQYT